MSRFVGRQNELKRLSDLQRKKVASFVVIRGRRRIGKSRLVEELSKNFDTFYSFIGLAPEDLLTKANQLDEFSRQMAVQFGTPRAMPFGL